MPRHLILVLMAIALCAADPAQPVKPNPFGSIGVRGSARIMVVPDEILVRLAAQAVEKDLQLGKASTDAAIQAVRAAAKELGVPDDRIQTDTIDINVSWRDRNDSFDAFGQDKRYFQIRRGITVCLTRIDQVDTLLTKAIAGGITTVDGIEFRTTKLRVHRDAARLQAINAAREKAQAMAGALGVSIGRPSLVEEASITWRYGGYNRSQQGAYQNVMMQSDSSMNASQDGTIAPGQIAIDADISARFELQ